MSGIRHERAETLPAKHKKGENTYEYVRRDFVPRGASNNCMVCIYEIPPLRSAYPYHYHHKNEEMFYIISGQGVLKTPVGEKMVSAGDLLFFPADENGAHKLTNASETETLVYLDVDVVHDLDVAIYPDSGKIGVWGKAINRLYREKDNVDYYDGE